MKTIMKTLVLVALVGVVFYGFDAFALDAKDGWQKAFNTMIRTFNNVKTIFYVVGAFGLIGIAVGGLMGKIKWAWLGYLAVGLAIVAAADMIIKWAVTAPNDNNQQGDIKIEEWNTY